MITRSLTILSVALPLAISGSARAEVFASSENIATISSVRVMVLDGVNDRCFFNKNGVDKKIRASLSRAGIVVDDSAQWSITVEILGFSTRAGEAKRRSGCVTYTSFYLRAYRDGIGYVIAAEDGSLNVGPQELDDAIMRGAEAFTDEVIAAMLQGRMKANSQP